MRKRDRYKLNRHLYGGDKWSYFVHCLLMPIPYIKALHDIYRGETKSNEARLMIFRMLSKYYRINLRKRKHTYIY